MNTNALQNALALLLKSSPRPLVEAAPDTARLPARAVGQAYQGLLVAELPNGRSLIEIEGVRLDVKLPLPMRVGDAMKLEVLALEPRLTFALVGGAAGTASDPVAMSDSARNLGALVDRLSREGPAPAASGATPVLASAPADTAAFAASLKTALAQSGLFYESHQARWVAGELPLADLMQEPQAALKAATEAVHPQAIGLVQQQLEALDTRQLVWQGQVWPNQALEWVIEEDANRESAAVDAPAVWKTSLRLSLPRLGEVSATLAIRGDQVHIAFSGLEAAAITAVRTGQVELRDAFGNAGLELLEIKVDRDEA